MRGLLDFKTNIMSFVEKNEYYALCVGRFILFLSAFLMIHSKLCYSAGLGNVLIPIALSIFCALIPMSIGMIVLEVFCLLNLMGLGLEVVAIVAIVMLIAHLLYFRFAKGSLYRSILTPVLAFVRMPYIMPVVCGLRGSTGSIVSVLFGMLTYSLLTGIKANETVFLSAADISSTDKMVLIIDQIIKNRELWVVIFAFLLTDILVYAIRRLSIKNAWRTAYLVGIAFNMVVILIGKLLVGESDGIVWLLVGSVISIGVAVAYEFIFMNLDYTRVEQVQFEDDNYYYYVKAVPKVVVRARQKSVKRFSLGQEEMADKQE